MRIWGLFVRGRVRRAGRFGASILVVAAVWLAAGAAVAGTGSESLSASPTQNLADVGLTSVAVTGSSFVAGASIQVQQCSSVPGRGLCVGIADLTVGLDGAFSTSVAVSYNMRGFAPGSGPFCDTSSTTTCDLMVVSTGGGDAGTVLASTPLTFAGHTAQPPVAVLTVTPDSGSSPLEVQVSGEGSYDPDLLGGLTDYTFDFGDGTPTKKGFSAGWPHTYAAAGDYTVTLTVTDTDGEQDTDTHLVSVGGPANNLPNAYIYDSYPTTAQVGSPVSFEFYGNDLDSGVDLSLDFGDESPAFIGDETSGNTDHIYTQAGSYIPVLTVTDDQNATTVYQGLHAIVVSAPDPNLPPEAQNQSVTTAEDTAKSVTLTATDPNVGDTLTYTVTSGPTHGTIAGTAPNLVYTPFSNYNGPDQISFVASDGTLSAPVATVSITVTPVNDAPSVVGAGTTIPVVGMIEGKPTSTQSGAFTDADDSAATAYQATISWGDGTSEQGSITKRPNVKGVYAVNSAGFQSLRHAYARFGTYDVTLTVIDGPHVVTRLQFRVSVSDAPLDVQVLNNDGRVNRLYPPGARAVACATDTNPLGTRADVTATINWGDGSSMTTTTSGDITGCPKGSTFSIRASHTYTKKASFTITVTLTSVGGSTATDSNKFKILA
jgi:PKD repeat protein